MSAALRCGHLFVPSAGDVTMAAVSAEKDAFTRCEKHGLTYDPRISKGCVLCRRQLDALPPPPSYGFSKLIGLAVVAGLAVFGWNYAKSVSFSIGDLAQPTSKPLPGHQVRGVGQAPDAGMGRSLEVPEAPDGYLRPYDALLWGGLETSFQQYFGSGIRSVQELSNGFGVNVYVPPPGAQFYLERERLYGKRPQHAQINRVAQALLRALYKYPIRLAHRIGLHHLVLMGELRRDGELAGAFTLGPAFALIAEPNAVLAEADVHHHLFHLIDYQVHGEAPEYEEWLALDPKGFLYRRGGRTPLRHAGANANRLLALRCNIPGFVSEHAQVGVSEDMAETFSQLMTHRVALQKCIKTDAVLAAKVNYVLQMLDQVSPGTRTDLQL